MLVRSLVFSAIFHFTFVISQNSHHLRRVQYGESAPNKLPYMAALVQDPGLESIWAEFIQVFVKDSKLYQLVCGGSIYSTRWVLTAAHCIDKHSNSLNYVGVDSINYRDMTYHDIAKKIKHPKYEPGDRTTIIWDNDIGLIKTSSDINSKLVDSSGYITRTASLVGGNIYFYGWGRTAHDTYSETMNQLKINYATDIKSCNDHVAVKAGRTLCFRVPKVNARAGRGDSGSPIVLKQGQDSVVSLISASVKLVEENKPNNFYVQGPNLTYYVEWIQGVIQKN